MLGVAVGLHQAPGEPDVGTGQHRGVQVGVTEHQPATGTQDPAHLTKQGVGIRKLLQHVMAEDHVHRRVGQWQRVGQVGLDEQRPRARSGDR